MTKNIEDLKVGDRVRSVDDPTVYGTVVDVKQTKSIDIQFDDENEEWWGLPGSIEPVPTEYIFAVYEESAIGATFYITSKDFWDAHHCIEDFHQGDLGGLLDKHWSEESESTYTYWNPDTGEIYDAEAGRQKLIELGFKEVELDI